MIANGWFYLSGTLLHRIEQCAHFDESEASRVVRDIAMALVYLHDRGIAHRDLKPANILCENADKVSVLVKDLSCLKVQLVCFVPGVSC